MKRYKFKTSKKIKTVHRKMIKSLGAENIKYEYEHYYFSVKPEKQETLEAHFTKIRMDLLPVV